MTRLVESDIDTLAEKLAKYDVYLREVCGRGLAEIARAAAKKHEAPSAAHRRVAVTPVTSSLGVINGFCETVAAIAGFLGYSAHVTNETDLAGMAEAILGKNDVIMAADDNTFIALNPKKHLVSDNSEATGRGYAVALAFAAKGLSRKKVLLLGAGPVGQAAAAVMLNDGAELTVFDKAPEKAAALRRLYPSVNTAENLEDALSDHLLLFDATPAGAFIRRWMLRQDTIIAAPGVPLCLDQDCAAWMQGRLLHDVLEIGVAVMLADVL